MISPCAGFHWSRTSSVYVDDYERLIYSQVVWHSLQLENKAPAGWGRCGWAIYHDLKHAGLLDSVGSESDIYGRAIEQLGRDGTLRAPIVPSELQDSDPFWEEPLPDKPSGTKTLEELEDSLSRSIDKIVGGCVMQAEGLTDMCNSGVWKERGFGSFGDYVEQEQGIPAEAVMRSDGNIRPVHELAQALDEWSPSTFLADTLIAAAHQLEREEFVEKILEPTNDEDRRIPVEVVIGPNDEPYPKPEMARRLHRMYEE
jgi:hypothetical protein